MTLLEQGSKEITLIGSIDTAMATKFQAALAENNNIDTLVIDSYGGDIDAAMDIAELIGRRKMHMVVDGRCLSACANYLFPAAATKIVLPGSVLAIHGLTVNYVDGGQVKRVSESQAADLFQSSVLSQNRDQFKRSVARQDAFYRQLGLRTDLYAVFAHYLGHRKQLFGTDMISTTQHAQGCPPVQMWALDKAQLEASGVRGIKAFWTPSSEEQKAQMLRDLSMPPGFLYYGPAAGLERLCTQPLSHIESLRLWLARTFTR